MLEKNGIKNVTNYINQQSYYEKSEKVPNLVIESLTLPLFVKSLHLLL